MILSDRNSFTAKHIVTGAVNIYERSTGKETATIVSNIKF